MEKSVADLQNPFSLEPVRVSGQFFGRTKEICRTLDLLRLGQCVSVVGSAKSGKTSFLFHVAHPDVHMKYGFAGEYIFIYLDSRSLANCVEGQCYISIMEETLRQVRDTESVNQAVRVELEKVARGADLQSAFWGLEKLFRTIRASKLKLVMLLDDFEFLVDNLHLDENFFSALRSLYTKYPPAYLVASQSPLGKFKRIQSGIGSPFFNCFQSISLESLTREESRELVITLLKHIGVEFPQFVVECILELGDNEPCRLQRAGYVAFQVWQRNGGVLETQHCEEIRWFLKDEHDAKHL